MSRAKVHPLIKNLMPLLTGKSRFLFLGPLAIEREYFEKVYKEVRPEVIFFIDGGLIHKKKFLFNKKALSLSLGDGDSGACPEVLLPPEKDFSDLAFGLLCLSRLKPTKVALLGFSGKEDRRPDHLLQNLGEIFQFVQKKKITVVMDQFTFYPAGKSFFTYKGTFSLFSFSRTRIRMTGKIQYPVIEWKILEPFSSLGLSNRAGGKVQLENKKTVVVYRAGENII